MDSVDANNSFQHELEPGLIKRLQAGDLAAFEHMYRHYERAAYTLALRLTAHPESARDVLQDAMLKAFQRAHQYRGEAPFWTWLRRLVVNEALMRLRRERRYDIEPFTDVHADENGDAPWRMADAACLDRALAQLTDTARAVLWLYHVEGFTHAEIAAEFGRSASFSKSQLARGTRRLRELLQPTVEDAPCMISKASIA